MSKTVSEVVIISEDLLKKYSPISANVGVAKIFPYAHLSQDFYVRPILGDALLNDLQIAVSNGKLSDSEKALILKVAPMLANYTTYLALRSLAYSVTEKGLTKEASENSESLDRTELGDLKLELKQTAEQCAELLVRYLCVCRHNYPQWQPYDECQCEKYEQKGGKAHGEKTFPMFFPNRKKESPCGCGCGTKEPPTAPMWTEISEQCEQEY